MKLLLTFFVLALATATSLAYDPNPLQDICVAINSTDGVFVNGKFCKDPKLVTAHDFLFTGLRNPGNTSNPHGSADTPAYVDEFPGVNTLGISMSRLDFAPGGLHPIHYHPRGSEIMAVTKGTVAVVIIIDGHLFTNTLYQGDIIVIPIGQIHFQVNVGETEAVALSAFNSQNPGEIEIRNYVFGPMPRIPDFVLEKDFHVDKKVIRALEAPYH